MTFFLKIWLRNARLKKFSDKGPTGLLPLRNIRTAIVLVDGTEPGCRGYADRIGAFLKGNRIEVSFIYIDLRKISKGVEAFVEGENVISRKDVTWFGMPRMKRKGVLFLKEADLLVNLRDSDDFTGDFISKTVKARFRIGACAYKGNPFDLVISGRPSDTGEEPEGNVSDRAEEKQTLERIDAICNFLNQIV